MTADKHQKNCGDGLPTMPGGRCKGRQILHTEDDGIGAELKVEVAGAGALSGVQGGLGKGVTGYAPPNPERRDERGVAAEG